MEQIEILAIEPEGKVLYCLPELSVSQDQDDPQVFRLVIETTNYRIEIEIG
jgi:hypothetical protein